MNKFRNTFKEKNTDSQQVNGTILRILHNQNKFILNKKYVDFTN